jgi:hypothetical protein
LKGIFKESSEKVFFNADIRKSNADKRRFSDETSATICVQSAGICVQENFLMLSYYEVKPRRALGIWLMRTDIRQFPA